jgi:methyltransferase of ATP-grasp peptide maturase system
VSTVEDLRAVLVERLVAAGHLRSRPWIDAFEAVPRHVFLERFFRQPADSSGWQAISASDPGALELIYTDATWVTQLDDDPGRWEATRASGEPARGIPTSSSSEPTLMALMLEALDVHDGHRVLEVGTGTGYNAALLCHRLGSELVTTVEVDPAVAEVARIGLRAGGYAPSLAVADGATGYPARAPYDRLIATCSTPAVPPEWLAQVRPGGLVLTSLYRDLGGGPLVLLRVDERGGAEGRFLPEPGGFMPVRSAGVADAEERLDVALRDESANGDTRPTALGPEVLDGIDVGLVGALSLPGVARIEFEPVSGPQSWLLADDGSWAFTDQVTGEVTQHGARRLWDEVEDTHRRWREAGSPSRERFGLTVTPSGEHVLWLDSPRRVWRMA